MPEKLLEYGLAGGIMAAVFMVVISPMLRAMIGQIRAGNEHAQKGLEEITALRMERQAMCERHIRHDDENLAALKEVNSSLRALSQHLNGGG